MKLTYLEAQNIKCDSQKKNFVRKIYFWCLFFEKNVFSDRNYPAWPYRCSLFFVNITAGTWKKIFSMSCKNQISGRISGIRPKIQIRPNHNWKPNCAVSTKTTYGSRKCLYSVQSQKKLKLHNSFSNTASTALRLSWFEI